MWQKRTLLYHRGVDDNIGTYVTDYVYSVVCMLLCIQLFIRIRRERRHMTQEQRSTSSCRHVPNWLPWNWPKDLPITLTTIGVFMLGFANVMMALFGGLTHQYVQQVEPYESDEDVWNWLFVWRLGASFSACMCLGLLIMTEQLLFQESVIRLPRPVRAAYYIICVIASLALFGYNFAPLSGKREDPFSIKLAFVVCFGVMAIYGISTFAVVIRHYCCRSQESRNSSDTDVPYSPAHSVESGSSDRRPYKKEVYSCCKNMFVKCHGNDNDVTSRKWELILTVMSPWIYIIAGVINHFLRTKCADSDDAYGEKGCPFPNAFNHNSFMHLIQIFSMILFFWAENLSITRRSRVETPKIRRITTSSTIYNDVINACAVGDRKASQCLENNNKPSGRDDAICKVKTEMSASCDDVTSTSTMDNDVTPDPKFPTNLNFDSEGQNNRHSVYDNMISTAVTINLDDGPWEMQPEVDV